ncbi:MAG TPA: flavodoxin family protein [Thermodesulforhabdus norvegica]|uniref:Flavodoxin family protein n=1 Tax=Thermodesulforhabdus norvegica TaxID=39841 RepID=A0A7C1AX72_9BACT|nr:flavodoxin family protein [Thermodesulforhabdus norvegica]
MEKRPKIVAIYGSPRKDGNTDLLLRQSVAGAREERAEVKEFFLRDLRVSPCLEIYKCRENGRCAIRDDFQMIADAIDKSQGIIIATPVFFYGVSAHTKAFIDRCQSLWIRKYWIEKVPFGTRRVKKLGFLISAGATKGKKLFDGILLTVQYFFDAIDAECWKSLLYRGLDGRGEVLNFPAYLQEARDAGRDIARELKNRDFS